MQVMYPLQDLLYAIMDKLSIIDLKVSWYTHTTPSGSAPMLQSVHHGVVWQVALLQYLHEVYIETELPVGGLGCDHVIWKFWIWWIKQLQNLYSSIKSFKLDEQKFLLENVMRVFVVFLEKIYDPVAVSAEPEVLQHCQLLLMYL